LMAILAGSSGWRAHEVAERIYTNSIPTRLTGADGEAFTPITLRGKGGIIATVHPPTEIVARLIHYRDFERAALVDKFRRETRAYREPRELFIKEKDGKSMTQKTVSDTWAIAKSQAGLKTSDYDFHGLRHTYAYSMIQYMTRENQILYKEGRPMKDILTTLCALMRHAQIESTQIYLTAFETKRIASAVAVNELFDSHLRC
jgi:site-specific recombinase XerD